MILSNLQAGNLFLHSVVYCNRHIDILEKVHITDLCLKVSSLILCKVQPSVGIYISNINLTMKSQPLTEPRLNLTVIVK